MLAVPPLATRPSRRCAALVAVLLAGMAAGCAGPATTPPETGPKEAPGAPGPLADLDATLWVQTSAEYRGAAHQAYRLAREQLDRALADSTWTAAREQEEPYRDKRPAVILDVDETVLDNSPYQARLLLRGGSFSPETWDPWVEEARAPAVPGALEFTRYADERGVRVFYVTNRDAHLEEATRENLRRLDFPVDTAVDVALMQGERPGWDDKTERREHVARDHRILLLIGDNLHDFAHVEQPSGFVRTERVNPGPRSRVPGAEEWGRRWIVLPNPAYGSWESALFPEGWPSTLEGQAEVKLRRLAPLRGEGESGG